jgi:hypothetical protein
MSLVPILNAVQQFDWFIALGIVVWLVTFFAANLFGKQKELERLSQDVADLRFGFAASSTRLMFRGLS